MASTRKFYSRVFHIEILSESHIDETLSLEDIAYLIGQGPCSGQINSDEESEHTGSDMATMLNNQGSDPSFFSLTPDGNDDEDEEE